MILIPLIVSSVTIVFILLSPCIFKLIFKTKNCYGYGLGLCCFILTVFINIVILIISTFIIFFGLKEKMDYIKRDNINEIINSLIEQSLLTIIILFVTYSLIKFIAFIMLFTFTKRLANQDYAYKVIFTFISGYILLFIFPCLIVLFLSVFDDKKIIGVMITIVPFLLLISGLILLNILYLSGAAIMLFLYQKGKKNVVIISCVITFFGPIIALILVYFTKRIEFLYYPFGILYLASFILGIIFYCIYSFSSEDINVYGQSFIQPQSPIQPYPPY